MSPALLGRGAAVKGPRRERFGSQSGVTYGKARDGRRHCSSELSLPSLRSALRAGLPATVRHARQGKRDSALSGETDPHLDSGDCRTPLPRRRRADRRVGTPVERFRPTSLAGKFVPGSRDGDRCSSLIGSVQGRSFSWCLLTRRR